MWVVDEKCGSPLYAQLYAQIRADILSGTLKAGARLGVALEEIEGAVVALYRAWR